MHHSQTGYYVTFVRHNGKPKRVMTHRAVAECWLGKCPLGYEVDHKDRNAHNNHYSNLRYVTKNEQMKNRNHTNIAKKGAKNFEIARQKRMKPVRIYNKHENYVYESFAAASRFLSKKYDVPFESVRYRFRKHQSYIYDYNIQYLSSKTPIERNS